MKITVAMFGLLCLMFAGMTHAFVQSNPICRSPILSNKQVVALDECDPTTFNAALGLTFVRISRWDISRRCPTCFRKRNLGIRTRTGTSN